MPSLRFTSVASATAIVATQPVWAALLARWQGHHIPRAAWAGIVTAVCGVAVLTGLDLSLSRRALLGDLLALLGAVFAAAYVTTGAVVRRGVSTLTYTAVCYSTAGGALLVACLAAGLPLSGYPARTWWEIAALTAGPQLLGHSVFNRVLRTTSATVVSLAILFEVPGAALLALLVLHQRLRPSLLPAAALLLAGIVTVVWAGSRAVPVE